MTAIGAEDKILEANSAAIYRHFSLPARVSISRLRVECAFKSIMRVRGEVIVHRRPEIRFIHARLLPYPFRTTIELIGDHGERAFLSPYRGLRPIREALEQAGFAVRDSYAWFFSGGQLSPGPRAQ